MWWWGEDLSLVGDRVLEVDGRLLLPVAFEGVFQ